MAGRETEAERLRRCREMFERSQRDGIPMAEARDVIARERWGAAQSRLRRCGTLDAGATPQPASAEPDERPQFWWLDQ